MRTRERDHRMRRAARTLALMAVAGAACAARADWPWTTTALSSPPLPAGYYVHQAAVSPNGRIAVYVVLQQGVGARELRCVSLDAQAGAVSLTSSLSDAFTYGDFVFSPDSRRVAFVAYAPSAAGWVGGVWSVEVCRPGAVPVSQAPAGEPAADARMNGLRFAPDGQRVLFLSDWQAENVERVYSAPATGGPAVDLGGALATTDDVEFEPTPDGQFVLLGQRSEAGFADLVRVPVAGPASAGTVLVHGTFAFAELPDLVGVAGGSGRIVFRSFDDLPAFGQWQLYSAPLAPPGDRQVLLNPTLTLDGTVVDAILSPDGARVAYVADQAQADVYQLYSVPVAGPSAAYVKLNPPLPAGSPGVVYWGGRRPFFLPDASHVVYQSRQDSQDWQIRTHLYSVPSSGPGSASVRLDVYAPLDGYFRGATASPDAQLVVFTGAEQQAGTSELHLRRADGSGPELDLSCGAADPVWGSGDSDLFAFCQATNTTERQLYHWYLTSSPAAYRLDVTPLDDGDSGSMGLFGVSPRTGGVLFAYDRPTEGIYELFTADRRVYWGGFENGSTAGWSAVVP